METTRLIKILWITIRDGNWIKMLNICLKKYLSALWNRTRNLWIDAPMWCQLHHLISIQIRGWSDIYTSKFITCNATDTPPSAFVAKSLHIRAPIERSRVRFAVKAGKYFFQSNISHLAQLTISYYHYKYV